MRDALGAVQSVLLVGGTSEIGLAIVRRLGRDGRLRRVVLAGRPGERLDQAAQSLGAELPGCSVTAVAYDALCESSYAAAVDAGFAGEPLDVAILAVGRLGDPDPLTTTLESVRELARINYLSAVETGTLVVHRLLQQGSGALVVLSSVAAERSRADNFGYASTKAGLDAWALGLADAVLGSGVQVLVVRPGFVRTRMTAGLPEAPLSTSVDVVADAVADGLRRGSTLIWAPVAVRYLMSGLRHLPRPVFRAVAARR